MFFPEWQKLEIRSMIIPKPDGYELVMIGSIKRQQEGDFYGNLQNGSR